MQTNGYKIYPQIWPDLKDWPIYKLSEDRPNFLRDIELATFENLKEKYGNELDGLISKTVYMEKIRLSEEPWAADPPNEMAFWKKIQSRLADAYHTPDKTHLETELLKIIIHRYAEEVVGNFKIPTFKFARKFLTAFFRRLLNAATGKEASRYWTTRVELYERIKVKGPIEKIRTLIQKGTVVVVPTHFSNLDSILIGYALDYVMGLPAFSYGAGLNLYNSEFFGYFMNRLGAYRVDRRKKNPVYLEVLKTMSTLSLERRTHTLFFPGGTRSRSGALEERLKLGLLGTLVEAQRSITFKGQSNKIIIVPLVLSYHCVLEAPYLINQHLAQVGKEKFLTIKDDFKSIRNVLRFIWQFFSTSSDITLSFGEPMDFAGNEVDEKGQSINENGLPVKMEDYFMFNERLEENSQREQVYTKHLSDKLVKRFKEINVVLTSHIVAFAAFIQLKNHYKELELFGLLRLEEEDFDFGLTELKSFIYELMNVLLKKEQEGQLKVSNHAKNGIEALMDDGIKRLGAFHVKRPLKYTSQGKLVSEDFKLLFFYHNRLAHYNLEKDLVNQVNAFAKTKTTI